MAYQSGSYRDGTQIIDADTDSHKYDNFNWGATQTKDGFINDNNARFDPYSGRAEAESNASLVGQGGCAAKVAQKIKINGEPLLDLSIVVDADWRGIMEIIGVANARLEMRVMVVKGGAEEFLHPVEFDVVDTILLENRSADATDIGSPIVLDGSIYSDENPSPLTIYNLSDGDEYRVEVYVQASVSAEYVLASARADAHSSGANAFNGYVRLNAIEFNWV